MAAVFISVLKKLQPLRSKPNQIHRKLSTEILCEDCEEECFELQQSAKSNEDYQDEGGQEDVKEQLIIRSGSNEAY